MLRGGARAPLTTLGVAVAVREEKEADARALLDEEGERAAEPLPRAEALPLPLRGCDGEAEGEAGAEGVPPSPLFSLPPVGVEGKVRLTEAPPVAVGEGLPLRVAAPPPLALALPPAGSDADTDPVEDGDGGMEAEALRVASPLREARAGEGEGGGNAEAEVLPESAA